MLGVVIYIACWTWDNVVYSKFVGTWPQKKLTFRNRTGIWCKNKIAWRTTLPKVSVLRCKHKVRARNTTFRFPFWGEKPFMHWYRVASCLHFIALHLVAIHSSLVDPAAPVHLNLRMRNVFQSASVAKISTITSSIVKSATTLQWPVNQSYYLLEQVGGFLLDITNPRKWFFMWTFF